MAVAQPVLAVAGMFSFKRVALWTYYFLGHFGQRSKALGRRTRAGEPFPSCTPHSYTQNLHVRQYNVRSRPLAAHALIPIPVASLASRPVWSLWPMLPMYMTGRSIFTSVGSWGFAARIFQINIGGYGRSEHALQAVRRPARYVRSVVLSLTT